MQPAEKMTRPAGYPDILADLAQRVAAILSARGVPAAEASEIGMEVAECARLRFGGSSPYTSKRKSFPEHLADLAQQVAAILSARGVPAAEASEIGMEVAEHERHYCGGSSQYIPKGRSFEVAIRNLDLYTRYNGRNRDALCREFDITISRFYQIIQTVRAHHLKRVN